MAKVKTQWKDAVILAVRVYLAVRMYGRPRLPQSCPTPSPNMTVTSLQFSSPHSHLIHYQLSYVCHFIYQWPF